MKSFKTFNLPKKTYKNLYCDEKTFMLANFLKCLRKGLKRLLDK